MLSRRTLVNLAAVLVAALALAGFGINLALQAVVRDTYLVSVRLPEAGGLLEDKEVTYRGVSVGRIDDVGLDGDGVILTLEMDQGTEIPTNPEIVVLRRSAVGEQALDLRPREPEDDQTTYLQPGDEIEPASITLPTKPQELLELADEVFSPVDEERAAVLVSELADAVRNRRDDVRGILSDSATFSEAVADNSVDYERLFASSRIVNASLAENRVVLGELITDLANSAELLGDLRDDINGLLDVAPSTLAHVSTLLERSAPNISCTFDHLADLNSFVAQPDNLFNASEALRLNEWFLTGGVVFVTAPDAQDRPWQRIQFILEPEPAADSYLPDKRDIPPTLPGGACNSPFGPGAGSAIQPSHTVAVPEGFVIRPANDRPSVFTAATGTSVPTAGVFPQAAVTSVPTPATGGGMFLAGLALLALAARVQPWRWGRRG